MSWLPNAWRARAALPAAMLVLGLCITVGGNSWLTGQDDQRARLSFQNSADRIGEDVSHRMRVPVYGLTGAASVNAVNNGLSRAAFHDYVGSRDMSREFPGVRGFGFVERLERDQQDAFVASERASGAPQFAIRQLEDKSQRDLYVVKYLEPAAGNAGAMGLDLGSERLRRDAIEQAVRTGEPTLTGAITLVQDEQRSPGFLLFLPLYRSGANPVTPDARRAALVGLVYAPIVAAEMLRGVADAEVGMVEFELSDDTARESTARESTAKDSTASAGTSAGALIFDSGAPAAALAGDAAAPAVKARFEATRTLPVSGRDLTLRVRSTPAFDAFVPTFHAMLRLFSGALLSLLLAAFVRQQQTGRHRAEALAHDMTADLYRLAQVVRHTSNAVSIADRDQRITWINERFTHVNGYTLEDALGKTHGELLSSGKADPAVLQTLADSAAAGIGCRVEILNRAKDGHDYWFDAEVQPMFDACGQLSGFMEIGSDVTERHRAQAQLDAARRDTDALLRTLDRHAIVSMADAAGDITEVNDAFCRISGYSRDELLGHNHRIVNSGLQPHGFWVGMWRTVSSGTPWRESVCNRAKDGSLYWVDTLIAPFVGADGRVEKYVSIHTDITAAKRDALALEAQRQRLDNIIEGTQGGTWELNYETGQTIFNERWAQIVGYTLEELGTTDVGTWSRLTHPDDLSRAAVLLERHFDGDSKTYACEMRMRHKDGHWVWVHTRGKVFGRSAEGHPQWIAGTHMDITERKLTEAALLASRTFLDRTSRIAGVGGWSVDLATLAIEWSDQTCRIHDVEPGHRPTLAEALNYFTPEARPVIDAAVQKAIATGVGYDLELPFITATGRPIWVRVIGEVECKDGKPARLAGAIQDVTARYELKAELQRKNELIGSVLENLPCGLSVFDADLNLVVRNAELGRVLDLPGVLLDGANVCFEDVIRFNAARGEYGTEDLEAKVQAIIERARAPAVPHQFERVRPNGPTLEVRGGPLPGGGFVTTYTDVSARKQAEAQAERGAQLLRGAIDTIDEAFALFDAEDRLVLCNQRHRNLYPLTADMMVPGNTFEQILRAGTERGLHDAAIGRIDEWVAERMALHRQPSSQLIQRLNDGRVLRVVERRMPDGHTVGFRVDVTELTLAVEAAEEASRSKGQFLANMSHEIRTPMNAILGMLALLRKTELTTRQADYAVKTEGAAHSLLGLLNDILDFSKVEAGKMTLEPNPFRTDQLLRDLSVIMSANIGAKPVEVLFDIDPALPRCLLGDAMRLQQVLINLSGNAIKFTPQGEVVVSMAVVAREADTVTMEVAVRDTGIGIAPENQARIFTAFNQAEASTTRRFGGTGLGLVISLRLVALMGGELRLDSALGQGSRFHFRITLPVVADVADDVADLGPQALPAHAAPVRALVIDDNPTAREVLERMCLSLGWGVDMAEGGEAALTLLQARAAAGGTYQAVFVDWQMPGLDGWQTSQRIRELGLTGDAPVVVMVTAHGREMLAQRSEAEQALIDGFLVKPVTASMLFDAVADGRSEREQPHLSRVAGTASGHRLAGLRLLVVEDNLNNQQVARELLGDEGATVQIANHGLEAVEAVAAAAVPFDVVLMDLQMPVMDGFTATRRIRDDLGMLTLPIVAMTANAMASDREACLAAGMNDHVGKPFDLDHLVHVLRRHAGRQAAPERAITAGAAGPALPATLLDTATAAGVDLTAALNRLGGKREVYQRMLRTFVADLAAMPAQLRAQAAQGDASAAARLLHTLKGLAATLGARPLSAAAAQGEKLLAGGVAEAEAAVAHPALPDAVGRACAPVIEAITAAGPGLGALLLALQAADAALHPAPTAGSAAPLDATALLAALQAMGEQLRNADMAATDSMRALQRRFGAALGDPMYAPMYAPMHAPMHALDAMIGALDFDAALQLCQELSEGLSRGPHVALAEGSIQ